MGAPPKSNITLGCAERIRVPLPAAKIKARVWGEGGSHGKSSKTVSSAYFTGASNKKGSLRCLFSGPAGGKASRGPKA